MVMIRKVSQLGDVLNFKAIMFCPTGHFQHGNSAIPHQWGIPHRLRTSELVFVAPSDPFSVLAGFFF